MCSAELPDRKNEAHWPIRSFSMRTHMRQIFFRAASAGGSRGASTANSFSIANIQPTIVVDTKAMGTQMQ
jgi:hypothetical protein